MITIVDYGMGNLGSISNMLNRIGVRSIVSNSHVEISIADKLILPGVGSFDTAMNKINESGLRDILDKKAFVDKVPILGICLGMQLMTKYSEEGNLPGLGWIPATTKKFIPRDTLKVPHMGWNEVKISNTNPLTRGFDEEEVRFYFVHSYSVHVEDSKYSFFKTFYTDLFDSGIFLDNIYGVQFHPEKSHRYGKKLLSNFASL